MEIESKTLQDIKVETEECENGIHLIRHETLERILHENEDKISVECSLKCCNPNMVVVECTATLTESGKKYFKIGESNPSNLENEISRKYPATMAYNRAIDRALIAALELPCKKVYSSEEIQHIKRVEKNTGETADIMSDIPPFELPFDEAPGSAREISNGTAIESLKHEAEQKADAIETVSTALTDVIPAENNVINLDSENVSFKMDSIPADSESSDALMDDNEIILFGRFKGKTYGEVKKEDQFKAFINWVDVNNPSLSSEEMRLQAEQFKKMNQKLKTISA